MRRNLILLTLLTVALAGGVSAREDLTIGKIDLTGIHWGLQTFDLDVANTGDYLRFLVVETDVVIDGPYLTPHRKTRSNYYVLPGESKKVHPTILIPPTYGEAQIYVRVHDVVDTLDQILPSQTILEQPFKIRFEMPEGMVPYLQDRYELPPRVEDHPDFDNEFARLLFVFLDKGMSDGEIGKLANCDSMFVAKEAEKMVAEGYLIHVDNGYRYQPTFPVIKLDEAEATKPLGDAIADSLVALYQRTMPRLGETIDSLTAAGAMSEDSSDFLNPGGILLHPYPTIAGLSLWYDLGRRFITREAPLTIYDGTDPCNAHIPFYMYMVQGGPNFVGTNFYDYQPGRRSVTIYYGDTLPQIACDPDFQWKQAHHLNVIWSHAQSDFPEVFSIDTGVVRYGLNALADGADSLLSYAYYSLKDVALAHGHKKVSFGHRYWFWNYVSTRALDMMRKKGMIHRRGNGQFRFESIPVAAKG